VCKRKNITLNRKYDVAKLQNTETAEKFANTIKMRLQYSEHAEELNPGNWTLLKQTIVTTADEIIGRENKTRINYWFDNECAEATNENNKSYREMIKKCYTRNSEDIYKGKRRQEKKIHRQKKKTFLEEQLKEIENFNFQKGI
jgi:CRISPR/Cas system-associated endoribonuclease Cas2